MKTILDICCDICGEECGTDVWLDEFENSQCCSQKCHDGFFGAQYVKNFPGELIKGFFTLNEITEAKKQ